MDQYFDRLDVARRTPSARLSAIRRPIRLLCVAAVLSVAFPTLATEGGGTQYALGVETQFSGVMAPPGFHHYLYVTHYESTHSKNNDGDDNPGLAYFRIKADVIATRLTYVYPGLTFLGANVETRLAVALPTIDLKLGIARPAALGTLDRSGKTTGLADPSLFPVILGWHSPTLHQTTSVELVFPLGRYDVAKPINAGRNYYGIAPGYTVTWFPRDGWDISAKARYAFNSRNNDTRYRSGNEASLEMGSNYRVSEHVAVGASGYLYQQVTDDKLNGASVNGNGNRGRVLSLGPSFTYIFTPKLALVAKVQSEFGARNKSEGTRYWLQLRLPFYD